MQSMRGLGIFPRYMFGGGAARHSSGSIHERHLCRYGAVWSWLEAAKDEGYMIKGAN